MQAMNGGRTLVERLREREIGSGRERGVGVGRHAQRRRFYQNLLPVNTICVFNNTNHHQSNQYTNINTNTNTNTNTNISSTPLACFIKKFSPDGQFLICFDDHLRGVRAYRYRRSFNACNSSQNSFERYFSLHYERELMMHPRDFLCREFCLFSDDGAYLIVASSRKSELDDDDDDEFYDEDDDDEGDHEPIVNTTATTNNNNNNNNNINNNNNNINNNYFTNTTTPTTASTTTHESSFSTPNDASLVGLALDCVTFHVIHIATGEITDRCSFRRDFIQLPHHNGVYLYKDLFAVLSIQNQSIHIFQFKHNGKLVLVRVIGVNCFEDDNVTAHTQALHESDMCVADDNEDHEDHDEDNEDHEDNEFNQFTSSTSSLLSSYTHGFPPKRITGLKHRLLSYFFRRAQATSIEEMHRFCKLFSQYEALVLVKMQFLDEHNLLLKYTGPQCIATLPRLCSDSGALFVVYNMITTEIISVFENTSQTFADLFQELCSHFRACRSSNERYEFSSTCSNNVFLRDYVLRQKQALARANGSKSFAAKRLLSALPFSPQVWSDSPYFDQSLFRYDESLISSTDRPRPCSETPIRFVARSSEHEPAFEFLLHSGSQDDTIGASHSHASTYDIRSRSASYIFHPYEPFIIAIQQTPTEILSLNLHCRMESVHARSHSSGWSHSASNSANVLNSIGASSLSLSSSSSTTNMPATNFTVSNSVASTSTSTSTSTTSSSSSSSSFDSSANLNTSTNTLLVTALATLTCLSATSGVSAVQTAAILASSAVASSSTPIPGSPWSPTIVTSMTPSPTPTTPPPPPIIAPPSSSVVQ